MTLQVLRRAATACAVLLLVAVFAFAQSDNSTISGIVKDPSGASVSGAKVTVKNEGTGLHAPPSRFHSPARRRSVEALLLTVVVAAEADLKAATVGRFLFYDHLLKVCY